MVVPKKSDASGKQQLRIVDFRKLNELAIASFPLPNIIDIFRPVRKRQIFLYTEFGIGMSSNFYE